MGRLTRCCCAAVLLGGGVGLVLWAAPAWPEPIPELVIAFLAALVVLFTPGVRRPVNRVLRRLRTLSPRGRLIGAGVVTLASLIIVPTLNSLQHVPFQLLWHDEHQFRLQSRMLAAGRLWMPPHPLADSFDTFYVFTTPKYAAQSFPGAALMFAPGVWLDLPSWLMPMIVSALAFGVMWWVISEVTDPAVATVGLIALLGSMWLRQLAMMYLAQMPVLLLGLIAIAAWLKYRRSGRPIWTLVMGLAIGWGLITRPLDAACFALILGIGTIVFWVRRRPRHIGLAVALGVIGVVPFAALQAVFNHGITGSWTKSPFTYYNERDQPALAMGLDAAAGRRPMSVVPQKQWFYDRFAIAYLAEAADRKAVWNTVRERFNMVLPTVAPGLWVVPLALVGVLGLRPGRRWAVAALLPLYVVAYARYPIYLFHYIAYATPTVALLYGLSPRVVAACVPPRRRPLAEPAVAMLFIGMTVGGVFLHVPGVNSYQIHDREDRQIRQYLDAVARPAIVLFHANPNMYMHEEPVYNDDVLWPDDAPVIKAHDLPDANRRLFAYYAAVQPQRRVYVYDRSPGLPPGTPRMRLLGTVGELAKQFPTTRP